MSDPLFDGPGGDPDPGDPALAKLEADLSAFAHTAPLGPLPPRPPAPAPAGRRRRTAALLATGVVAAGAVAAVALYLARDAAHPCSGTTGFAFSLSTGTATCGGRPTAAGTLAAGAWLETHADAVAAVQVADIGELTVYGDSKLRLVTSNPTQHRLELARGHVAAKVTAPPRLFIVDTPAATAVDLGCQYDLVARPDGHTHLRVAVGAVSLEGPDGTAYVPATHEVEILPGHHVGTPVPITAAPELRAAVAHFDAGAPGGLAEVLEAAGRHDRVTLWNVVARTHGDPAAVARLEEFAPLPDPALRPRILAGDADALDAWIDVFVDRGDLAHDKRRK